METRTKLAKAIIADGRTAGQIAHAARVDQTTLSLIRNGRRIARLETAYRLARVLKTTPRALGLPDLESVKGDAR